MLFKIIYLLIFISIQSFQFITTASIRQKYPLLQSDDASYPIVTVSQGQLQGLRRQTSKGNTYYSFKGIPYAEPPVGSLRFRDPAPKSPWNGVYNAFNDMNVCPQRDQSLSLYIGDEDCLYLNVYTPNLPGDEVKKLPVVIFIHGGGLVSGSGIESELPPDKFVDNDVVFIAMNYRLGIFGLLSLDIPEVPGNAALKDQLLAIKWVHENIENFNGDKDKIILYGTSAGSISIDFQLLHIESEGLFQGVSMQSGSGLSVMYKPRNPRKTLEKLSNVIGVDSESYEILNALNSMTTQGVLQASEKTLDNELKKSGLFITAFTPVIEKTFPNVENFLTRDPLELYRSGNFVRVPTLVTFCRNEGTTFSQYIRENFESELLNRQYADFMEYLNVDDKASVNSNLTAFYTAMNVDEDEQIYEFASDLLFFAGIYQNLKYIVQDVSNIHYSYLFSVPLQITIPGFPPLVLGPQHGFDMFLLLFVPDFLLSNDQSRAKNFLETVHMNFIKYGNPTASGNITWDPITEESFKVLEIAGGDNMTMVPFSFGGRMEYWDSLYSNL